MLAQLAHKRRGKRKIDYRYRLSRLRAQSVAIAGQDEEYVAGAQRKQAAIQVVEALAGLNPAYLRKVGLVQLQRAVVGGFDGPRRVKSLVRGGEVAKRESGGIGRRHQYSTQLSQPRTRRFSRDGLSSNPIRT